MINFNHIYLTENNLFVSMFMTLIPYLSLVGSLKDLFLYLCYFCYILTTYLTPRNCLLFTCLLMTRTYITHVRTLKILN